MSNSTVIRRLAKIIEQGKDSSRLESFIALNIENYCKEPIFYTLPLNTLFSIASKCRQLDVKSLSLLIAGVSRAYGNEGLQILDFIPTGEPTEQKSPNKLTKFKSSSDVNTEITNQHFHMPNKTHSRDALDDNAALSPSNKPNKPRSRSLAPRSFEDRFKRIQVNEEQAAQQQPTEKKPDPFALIEAGNLEELKSLLDRNPKLINSVDEDNNTLLHIAAKYARNDIITYLLDFPIDIEKRNRKGWTALHFASMGTDASTVELLLDNGANVGPYGKDSPLHLAVYNDRVEIAELLLEHGADVRKRGFTLGFVPLGYAKSQKMIQLLTSFAE